MTAEIRSATRGDIPAMAAIVARWEAETDWNPAHASLEVIENALDEAFDLREIWVIGDPVEAYISVDPSREHIGGFYVGPKRQGYGKRLMDKVKEGRTHLTLNTHLPNADAQRFYAREGFTALEEQAATLDGMPDELKMEWAA
ncbi:Acetyltransferase (GNAT) domain-containing protein [Celeribacter neptunius]|uniref:Acetyltransferase (GNAT) domain-containing protein n=1 Tax=Celeribacter neptunius TaxID=588602 RepID=A0A1I3N4D6_9RHOB|nr:Acetyltransferase (GNAT) domain-containing protein [Celeribacter neptunius]